MRLPIFHTFQLGVGLLLSVGLTACIPDAQLHQMNQQARTDRDLLHIWWPQSFLPQENIAIVQLVEEWQRQSGWETELTLVANAGEIANVERALAAGFPPDILFGHQLEASVIPELAWQGALADVTEVVQPLEGDLSDTAQDAVSYLNRVRVGSHYYAVPIGQQVVMLHLWMGALEGTALEGAEVPGEWREFWRFLGQAQEAISQTQNPEGQASTMYGAGLPMSRIGNDTFWAFEYVLEGYGVKPVGPDGALRLDGEVMRAGVIGAIDRYRSLYLGGQVPPRAVTWNDTGNNNSFLQGQSFMTANSSLSIPLTQWQPENQYNQLSRQLYFEQMRTVSWPRGVNGQEIVPIVTIKQAVVFDSANEERVAAAKDLLSFLIQPNNLARLLEEGRGRLLPVRESLLAHAHWRSDVDPHVAVAVEMLGGETQPAYQSLHPAYGRVLYERVWEQAILSTLPAEQLRENRWTDGMIARLPYRNGRPLTSRQAADWAIAKIERIFAEWE
ncbi:MAG: ABC transporter substrate-binding protein [Synechococcus sp.]